MRRAILRPALAALGADQLGDLELHHLRRDGLDRLADHIGMLIEQHLPDDLLDRHPVGTGHRWRLLSSNREKSDDLSARVAGTTTGTEPRFDSHRPFRPTRSYTNPRDVTCATASASTACWAFPRASRIRSGSGGVSAETPGLRPRASVWDIVFDEPIGSGPLEIGGPLPRVCLVIAGAALIPTQHAEQREPDASTPPTITTSRWVSGWSMRAGRTRRRQALVGCRPGRE